MLQAGQDKDRTGKSRTQAWSQTQPSSASAISGAAYLSLKLRIRQEQINGIKHLSTALMASEVAQEAHRNHTRLTDGTAGCRQAGGTCSPPSTPSSPAAAAAVSMASQRLLNVMMACSCNFCELANLLNRFCSFGISYKLQKCTGVHQLLHCHCPNLLNKSLTTRCMGNGGIL